MRRWLLAALLAAITGCDDPATAGGDQCGRDDDCTRGRLCVEGLCVASDALPVTRDAARDGGPADAATADAAEQDGATPDARPADGAPPEPDAAPPEPDAAAPEPDAAPPEPDAAPPEPDAAPPEPDAAPPAPDAAPPEPDMAPPPRDAAPPPLDMAPPVPDAAPREPDMAPPEPDAAPPEPDAAPPVLAAYGEPCAAAADCQSNVCVGDPQRGGGVCTLLCNRQRPADCPGSDVCLAADGGLGVCFRNETGAACRDARDCIDGICLLPPDPVPWVEPQRVCVNRCVDDSKCPVGYSCRVVDTNNGPARACAPDVVRVNTCPNGFIEQCAGTCAAPPGRDPLDVTVCLNIDGPGYCSCTCNGAHHCPEGFACARIGLSDDPTRPGVCMPMSGYRCPQQIVGGGFDQCLTLTCIPDGPNPDDAYCSAQCGNDLDCPVGYTCRLVEDFTYCVPAE